jgi:UDP-3-O-[3-hydroxymyristoyl] glucosamine N-acyltransferase
MGRHCIVAAHTGISGSVKIGDGAMFGGRTGIVDHIVIGKGAKISAATVVLQDVAEGVTVSGYPARPSRQFLREMVWLEKNATKKNKGQ